jgi:hypothetical protein
MSAKKHASRGERTRMTTEDEDDEDEDEEDDDEDDDDEEEEEEEAEDEEVDEDANAAGAHGRAGIGSGVGMGAGGGTVSFGGGSARRTMRSFMGCVSMFMAASAGFAPPTSFNQSGKRSATKADTHITG